MKLCLGTVQFGLNYGINNALGRQPKKDESFAIIKEALASEINCFDTASVYGNAESLLGKFPWGNNVPRIISKLPPKCADEKELVMAKLEESRQRLHVKKLYGYMLHRAEDMNSKAIMDGMLAIKEQNLVDKIGVSVYEPGEAMQAAQDKRIDIIQIPYNVLDQRLDRAGFFELVKKEHKEVYARSAFLQGLLLMESDRAEARVNGSGKWVAAFQNIAKKNGYAPAEAAMLFSLYHPMIDYVVFGVETIQQLKYNVEIQKKLSNFAGCYQALQGAFSGVPREIVVPSLWN